MCSVVQIETVKFQPQETELYRNFQHCVEVNVYAILETEKYGGNRH